MEALGRLGSACGSIRSRQRKQLARLRAAVLRHGCAVLLCVAQHRAEGAEEGEGVVARAVGVCAGDGLCFLRAGDGGWAGSASSPPES